MGAMSELTFTKIAATAAALSIAGATLGIGTAAASSPMPLVSKWRDCDFTLIKWVDAVGYGRPVAYVGPAGDGSMVAKVDIDSALPNTAYNVRVVQVPRPSHACAAGDPGVLTGTLHTDAAGVGTTTIQGPIADGKTGAWVAVELPFVNDTATTEIYTSGFIASI